MKNKFSILALAAALALGTGTLLASCGGGTSSPSNPTTSDIPTTSEPTTSLDPTSVTSEKVAQRFETTQLDRALLVGESIDLADYITVVYADGSKDSDFTIQEKDGFTVAGTVVTFNQIGSYQLSVKAGSNEKPLRFPVTVESESRQAFNAWYNSISQEYSVYYLTMDEAQNLLVNGFAHHGNTDYFGYWIAGSSLNNVIAKLNDGNYYNGTYENVESTDKFDLKFNPGVANWNNSWGSVSLTDYLDSSSFVSTVDENGNEVIAGDAAAAETFINITYSLTYGGDALGIEFLGLSGDTPETQSGIFAMRIQSDVNDDGVITEDEMNFYEFFSIQNVNSLELEPFTSYLATGEIPVAIDPTPIDDFFKSAADAKNFTMLGQADFVNTYGEPYDISTSDVLTQVSPVFETTQITMYTENNVALVDASGSLIIGTFKHTDNKVYNYGFSQDETTGAVSPVTAVTDAESVQTSTYGSLLNVPTASVTDLTFSSYQLAEDAGIALYVCDAGYQEFDQTTYQPKGEMTGRTIYQLFSTLITASPFFDGDTSIADTFYGSPAITMNSGEKLVSLSGVLSDVQIFTNESQGVITIQTVFSAYWLTQFGVPAPADLGGIMYTWQIGYIGATEAPDMSLWTATIA